MFLIRRLHKWFGLVLGLQFLLWAISGAAMALIDHRKVAGEDSIVHSTPSPTPAGVLSLAQVAQAVGQPISRIELRPLQDAWVYAATTPSGVQLVDPVDGRRIVIDDARAKTLAVAAFNGTAPVTSVALVEKPTLETRDFALPAWLVEFADKEKTTLILNAVTGEVAGAKTNTWRLWDFFWMIHIMDYTDRQSFNHPLIIIIATGCLWLALSGFIMLFSAFRRQDFAYIHDGIEWLQRRR